MSRPLKILLLAALLNSLSWMVLIPLWQYPDEQSHFAQVQFKAELRGIPESNKSFDTSYEVSLSEKILGTERDGFGNNKYTYHPKYKGEYSSDLWGPREKEIINLPKQSQSNMIKKEATLNPPLYYLISSIIYQIFTDENLFVRVFAIRLLSVIFFLGVIIVTYKTAKLLFSNNDLHPIAITSMLSFKPMLVFASSGILPDSLLILLFSLFIYISLKVIKEGFNLKKIFLILLIIGLGSMTRQNFLIVLFILPAIFVEQFIVRKGNRKSLVLFFVLASSALYISSFFFTDLRFINKFEFPETSRTILGNQLSWLTFFNHTVWTIRHSVSEVWPWFWGVYKWLSLTLPPLTYRIINRIVLFIFLGIILKTWSIIQKKDFKKEFWFFFLILILFIYFMGITIFDYFFRSNNSFSFGIQGRYFFPPIMAFIIILFTGFREISYRFFKKYSNLSIVFLIVVFIFFNDFSLVFVSSSYYDISSINKFLIQASQYKPFFLKMYLLFLIPALNIIFQLIFIFYLVRIRNIMSITNESS